MSDDEEDFAPDFIDEDPLDAPADEDGEPETEAEEEEAEEAHSSEEETDVELEEHEDGSEVDELADDAADHTDTEAASDNEVADAKVESKTAQTRALAPIKGQPARAERAKIDPLMQLSNTPRVTCVIHPDDRRTSNILQKSEAAHILAKRATQIADSPTVFVDITGLHDPGAIAFKELLERRCPLLVRRLIAVDSKQNCIFVEDWDPNLMAHPQLVAPTLLSSVR